jgi:hypothetical protein
MRKTISLIFFLTLISCSKEELKIECEYSEKICSAIEKLSLNKKKWNDFNINSYSMNLRFNCFCLAYDPYSVVIMENNIESVSGNEEWGYEGWPMTIDNIFLEIERKIIDNPFSFEIKYNSKYGYPEESYFDMIEMIADEEIGYQITNFSPL